MNIVPFRSERIALALTMVLVLGGVAAHGQRPQGGGDAGGGTMSIDFTAVSADGKPVADLTPADVTVKIGGKARTVTALTLKTSAAGAPPAGAAPTGSTPPFFTNDAKPRTTEGRSIMIVVDTESLRAGTETAIKAAIENIFKGLTSADRVAFSTAPTDSAQVGFGAGLARAREAVAGLKGQRPATVNDADAYCRSHNTLVQFKSLLDQMAGAESPTAVIFIAADVSVVGKDSGTNKLQNCEVFPTDYSVLGSAVALARANVYVVQGDTGAAGSSNAGLQSLAGVTGAGSVARIADEGFATRVLSDASAYWVATLAPDPSDRPGQSQRLELKAVKAGVTIHARPEVAMTTARAGAGAGAAKPGASVAPKDMIASTAAYSDLQLQATAVVLRGQGEKMNVLVLASPVDPTVKITALRVGYFDAANKGASLDAPQIATYPITTVLPLDLGQYRIRVAAQAGSKSGAVDIDVNTTPTSAGPLKMSSLFLGAPDAKGAMTPRLVFTTEEKLLAFFEMYGTPTAKVDLTVELAKTDAGPAIKSFQPTGGGATDEPDKFAVVTEIPIKDLEPGDYVIRITMKMEGQPAGKIMRTFRKTAK
jgi:hypothetical protein